jgi:hypothetical protein
MANKAAAVNYSLGEMAKVISARLVVPWVTQAGVVPPTCYIPYDTANDLSDRSALRCIYMQVTGIVTDSVGFGFGDLRHPDKEHFFFCENLTDKRINVVVDTDTGGSVGILAGKAKMVYTTGAGSIIDVTELLGLDATATANDFNLQYYGQPKVGETMCRWMAGRQTVLAVDLAGAVGRTGSYDTQQGASGSMDIKVNGTKIGYVSIGTVGQVSVFSQLSADKVLQPSDIVSLHYANTYDAYRWTDLYLHIPGTGGLDVVV